MADESISEKDVRRIQNIETEPGQPSCFSSFPEETQYNSLFPVTDIDINLEIKSGETIALVGATGAGKSSIINLLNRFYEINRGTIRIDGVDIKEYELGTLRKNIGVVLQDVFLFSDTILQNISLGNNDVTEEMAWHAADLVGARKFIERLPGSFLTMSWSVGLLLASVSGSSSPSSGLWSMIQRSLFSTRPPRPLIAKRRK